MVVLLIPRVAQDSQRTKDLLLQSLHHLLTDSGAETFVVSEQLLIIN